ncbi:MAG: SdpI family protein [Verrucomicrobia bacterium]|nr:SdpI family protein [Verrucomicrobiota bacterium]
MERPSIGVQRLDTNTVSNCTGGALKNAGCFAELQFVVMTTLVLITDLFVGLLLILVAVPLRKNLVAPNRAYGVRIRQSLASPENWYRINRHGGSQLIVWSSLVVLLAAVGFFLPIEEASLLFWAYMFLPAMAALMACLLTLRFARKF